MTKNAEIRVESIAINDFLIKSYLLHQKGALTSVYFAKKGH